MRAPDPADHAVSLRGEEIVGGKARGYFFKGLTLAQTAPDRLQLLGGAHQDATEEPLAVKPHLRKCALDIFGCDFHLRHNDLGAVALH